MATRTYAGIPPVNAAQLGALIDAALGRTGTLVTLLNLDGVFTISVTHPSLVAGDDSAIAAVVTGYMFDPLFGLPTEQVSLHLAIGALRQWSLDADVAAAQLGTAVTNWTGTTYSAAKDAVIKSTLAGLQTLTTRLGRLADRIADVITVQGLS